ncbi:hypothetical protein WEI85_24855 [Actinomycetes bacterium KLBMP 9797]
MVETDDRVQACHWMLLRLAGWVSDGLLTQARQWLAQGRLTDVALSVAHAVGAARVEMNETDLALLIELHSPEDQTLARLSSVVTTDPEPLPVFGFAPAPPAPSAVAEPVAEAVAEAMATAAAGEPGLRGVWRSWRFPADGAPWPPPRQVFVVETDEGTDLVAVTGRLQAALAAAGEVDPQVETYPTQAIPPGYQQLARSGGSLLCARTPDPGVRIAAVFDGVDAQAGPRLNPDHPTIDDDERDLLLAYLGNGELLLETTSGMADVRDPDAGAVVPINFRTDGYWIWNDATTYYLYRYSLAPEPDLLRHIRARQYVFEEVDGAAMHRALAALEAPVDEEPVWVLGQ